MERRHFLALSSLALAGTCMPALAVVTGTRAPPLALPGVAGETIALEALQGSVVWVDFWASWCGPCKRSFPWMNELVRKYADAGLRVIAVNVDKKRGDADRFLARAQARFTVVFDSAGTTAAAWRIPSMPSSYLVDRTGAIVLAESGFRDERTAEVERRIRIALGLE